MTEAEWLATDDQESLLKWLRRSKRHRPGLRKLQLVANAYADRIADRFSDPVSGAIRRFMDRIADEGLTQEQMWAEWKPWWEQLETIQLDHIHVLIWSVGVSVKDPNPAFSPETHVRDAAASVCEFVGDGERVNQARIIRDVIGNPFRPVTSDPAWLSSTVVSLAEGIYADRAFDRMPILADALQDAGCDNADILTHCRSDGPHVRGCWVIDLLAGRK
jgi:hypothetical protein